MIQQYGALPAAVTLPLGALYVLFHENKHAGSIIMSKNHSTTDNTVGLESGRNIDIEGGSDAGESKVTNLGGWKWMSGGENLMQIFSYFHDDTSELCLYLLNHLLCFLVFHMIMKHSIFGIFVKILCKHVKELLVDCCTLVVYLKNSVGTIGTIDRIDSRVKRAGNDESECGDNDTDGDRDVDLAPATSEEFLDCSESSTTFKIRSCGSADSDKYMDCTKSSTLFKVKRSGCENATQTNSIVKGQLSSEKHAVSYIDADKGYESFVQSIIGGNEKEVVRNSTPREEESREPGVKSPVIMDIVTTEKFKRYLHQQRGEVVQAALTTEDDGGYVVNDESGDESLCGTRSIIF